VENEAYTKQFPKILKRYRAKSTVDLIKEFDNLYQEGKKELITGADEVMMLFRLRLISIIILQREGHFLRLDKYRMSGETKFSKMVSMLLQWS